jgi:hypothetical protein
VTGPGEIIAGALREIADEAVAPPRLADAAWLAGRRRRRARVVTASAAGLAAAIAMVVLLTLAVTGGSAQSGPAMAQVPVRLSQAVQLRQVARISPGRCPARSRGLSDLHRLSCVHLAKAGMTIRQGIAGWLDLGSAPGSYVVTIQLTHADRSRFAALTRELFRLPRPRNQLAVIISGHLIAAPTIETPITHGFAQVAGFTTRAQAERFIRGLPHRPAGPVTWPTARARRTAQIR